MQSDELPEGVILGQVRHTYSHFKVALDVVQTASFVNVDGWFTHEEIAKLALSSVDKKIKELYDAYAH